MKDHAVLKYNFVTAETKCYKHPGGLQEVFKGEESRKKAEIAQLHKVVALSSGYDGGAGLLEVSEKKKLKQTVACDWLRSGSPGLDLDFFGADSDGDEIGPKDDDSDDDETTGKDLFRGASGNVFLRGR